MDKKIKIRPFKFKWYEFLIIYVLINVFCFANINIITDNTFKNFAQFFSQKLIIDGSDLSLFAYLFAAPLFVLLAVINFAICILEEFITILIFKFIYFKSAVINEQKIKLNHYIKITILSLILANIIAILIYGNTTRIIIFVLLYWPVPLFAYVFIYAKIKKDIIKM